MPCRHICAVLKDIKYYDPAFFHIRWHKSFNYYYGNAFSKSIAPCTNETLNKALDETRATSYRDSGTYKGVLMKNSKFINDLPEFCNDSLNENIDDNAVVDLMKAILEHTDKHGPVLKDSIPLHSTTLEDESDNDSMFINNDNESNVIIDHCPVHFGGSSQTQTQLSTARLAIDNAPTMNMVIATSTYYKLALPMFEDMMNSCSTKPQFEEVINMMKTKHYKHLSENGKCPYQTQARRPVPYVVEQNNTNKKKEKRHKFLYEKRC